MAIKINFNTHRALRDDLAQSIEAGNYSSDRTRFTCPLFICEKIEQDQWIIHGWIGNRCVDGYYKHGIRSFFSMNGSMSLVGPRLELTEYDVYFAGQIIDGYLNGKSK